MRPLAQEQNIEVLREYAILATLTAERLAKELAAVKDEKSDAQASQDFLSHGLRDHLSRLQKKFFGFGRETNPAAQVRSVGHQGQICLVYGTLGHTETDESARESTPESVKKLPADQENYDFTTPALVAESLSRGLSMQAGADAWKKMQGLTEDTVEITVTERTYKRVVHRQAK